MRQFAGIYTVDGSRPHGCPIVPDALEAGSSSAASVRFANEGAQVCGARECVFEDEAIVVVGAGRFDERAALAEDLDCDASTCEFGAIVALAYHKWGHDCPVHLFGDYAFAVWEKGARRLFCARDHAGTVPLYRARIDGQLIVATRFAFIADRLGDRISPDERTTAEYLAFGGSSGTQTLTRDIYRLLPGSLAVLDRAGVTECQWWDPFGFARPGSCTPNEAADELERLFSKAVIARTPRSRFGAHLSGGLDSSSIAVLAAREARGRGQEPPTCFAWQAGDDDQSLAEQRAIATVSASERLSVEFCPQRAEDFLQVWSRPVLRCGTFNMVPLELPVMRRARDMGIRTILSGWGGDEVVSHNGRSVAHYLFRTGRWRRLARHLRAVGALGPSGIARAAIPPNLLVRWRNAKSGGAGRPPSFLTPRCLEIASMAGIREAQLEETGQPGARPALIAHGHVQARIESWNEAAAEHGLAYRYPMLDRRLLEFALSIPPHLLVENGRNRAIFRRALHAILPDELVWSAVKDEPGRVARTIEAMREAFGALRTSGRPELAAWQGSLVDEARLKEHLLALSDGSEGKGAGPLSRALEVLGTDGR